jgi:hypothetical protein
MAGKAAEAARGRTGASGRRGRTRPIPDLTGAESSRWADSGGPGQQAIRAASQADPWRDFQRRSDPGGTERIERRGGRATAIQAGPAGRATTARRSNSEDQRSGRRQGQAEQGQTRRDRERREPTAARKKKIDGGHEEVEKSRTSCASKKISPKPGL